MYWSPNFSLSFHSLFSLTNILSSNLALSFLNSKSRVALPILGIGGTIGFSLSPLFLMSLGVLHFCPPFWKVLNAGYSRISKRKNKNKNKKEMAKRGQTSFVCAFRRFAGLDRAGRSSDSLESGSPFELSQDASVSGWSSSSTALEGGFNRLRRRRFFSGPIV